MQQICRMTGQAFEITASDLEFYKKMGVPVPTLCPEERQRRRLAWRNDRHLYHRTCTATGEKIIAMYAPNIDMPIYENKYWWSDLWDGRDFGRDFDFNRGFFEQFKDLLYSTPKQALIQQGENPNSQFTNCASYNKNCYLIFNGSGNEDCMYGSLLDRNKDCLDCLNLKNSELSYFCVDCSGNYDSYFCQKVHNSNVMHHCSDCRNCENCFACVGLRNKKNGYWVLNEKVTADQFKSVLSDSLVQEKSS